MAAETWIALLAAALALFGVWLGGYLGARSSRIERQRDVLRDSFGRYLAGCAAWSSLASYFFDPQRFIRPSDAALADADAAGQVLFVIAPRVAEHASVYLASLQVIADDLRPNAYRSADLEEREAQRAIVERTGAALKERREAVLYAMRKELAH